MNERDTMAEIRSVFSKGMKDDPCFEFSTLHPIGRGSKSLMVLRTSASFVWNAHRVCTAAGRGSIYVLAKDLGSVQYLELSQLPIFLCNTKGIWMSHGKQRESTHSLKEMRNHKSLLHKATSSILPREQRDFPSLSRLTSTGIVTCVVCVCISVY